jgi:hypothetical protein
MSYYAPPLRVVDLADYGYVWARGQVHMVALRQTGPPFVTGCGRDIYVSRSALAAAPPEGRDVCRECRHELWGPDPADGMTEPPPVQWYRLHEIVRLQPSATVGREILPGVWHRLALFQRLSAEQVESLLRLKILEALE